MPKKIKVSSFQLRHKILGIVQVDRADVSTGGEKIFVTVSKTVPSKSLLAAKEYWNEDSVHLRSVWDGLTKMKPAPVDILSSRRQANNYLREQRLEKVHERALEENAERDEAENTDGIPDGSHEVDPDHDEVDQ